MPSLATRRSTATPRHPTDSVFPDPRRGSWLPLALCRGVDPELFYPVSEKSQRAEPAKAVCARCPVCPRCRADVLATEAHGVPDAIHGVCGGLSAAERRELHPRVVAARNRARAGRLGPTAEQVRDGGQGGDAE